MYSCEMAYCINRSKSVYGSLSFNFNNMAERIGEDPQAEGPLSGEGLRQACARQTDSLLRLGLAGGTSVDHLLVVHGCRGAIEDGDLHRAVEMVKFSGLDKE